MKKILTAAALLGLMLPVASQALEFQPIGAVGMGGAGVARNNGALTAYWNPAGGAFNESPFAMSAGFGIGVKGSDGLAENVDRLNDIKFDDMKNFDSATATVLTVGNVVKSLTILDDIQKRNGYIAINGQVPIGFSIKHVSFGLFGNFEGYIKPNVDVINILPSNTTGATTTSVSVQGLYDAAVNGAVVPYTPSGYFSSTQLSNLATQFQLASTLSNAQALQLAYAMESQLKNSGLPQDTAYNSLVTTIIPTIASGGTNTFDKNTSSVITKAIMYYEVPLAYGYPLDLGRYGKLGIGATAKIISGTVYQSQVLLVNRPGGGSQGSDDLTKDITKNSKSSTNFGIDLGALYKYDTWFSAGLVAKNLNSPKFDAPDYDAVVANDPAHTVKKHGEDVKMKPQIRTGVAFDPYSWLTIAADLDLTNNETVAPGTVVGSSVKSRNLGGGAELHPYSWLKLRGGAYKNLSQSDIGLVLTGGFSLFLLDVDGAFATDTFKVGSSTIPQEAKVQLALSFAF
jgi:hypothetical protein